MNRTILFLLFFVSGFCSLVYEVVWTRLAFASFGIITPVLSVVISVFMLGLSVGAWAGGRWVEAGARRTGWSALRFYAVAELLVGLGAFAVPHLFRLGERLLLSVGQSNSLAYLSLSALALAVAILPWCVCMGASFPLVMAYIRERSPRHAHSFSYLYLANVLGAMSGTLLTAFVLVELFGFRDTLHVAAAGNFVIAVIGWALGRGQPAPEAAGTLVDAQPAPVQEPAPARSRFILLTLFTTGFVSMAMEVIWTRAFGPVLKTQVYSFALVVATYLGATSGGSLLYRWQLRRGSLRSTGELLGLLCVSAFLPVVVNDVRLVESLWWMPAPSLPSALLLMGSILPFCAVLGYLTPALVDEYAGGCPRRSGAAYALNVLGCILGPLFACYLLLPQVSERLALVLMGLPFAGLVWVCLKELSARKSLALGVALGMLLFASSFYSEPLEDFILRNSRPAVARRDYAASVLAFGSGMKKALLVNGVGMTKLTPITKLMAHLPLAFHQGRPESALVICLGMGTSFRSALSWDIPTTAVELVPGVRDCVGFFHTNSAAFLSTPKGHLVVDDGRRYLQRTRDKYDVIVVDPPPPLTAAGSSLLYSVEFYELAKQRLQPGGILQVWIPEQQVTPTTRAMLRSVWAVFPHVRCFISAEGWGIHVLASMAPLEACTAAQLAARMPERAKADLLEWEATASVAGLIAPVLAQELETERMLDPNPLVRITDDQPFNEYFLLRAHGLY